jgi:hypothetical protein
MSEEIRNSESGYYVAPRSLVSDVNLTDTEKLVLMVILSLSELRGYCFATNSYLAEILGKHKDTISKTVSNLGRRGYITREIVRDETGEIVQRKIFPRPRNIVVDKGEKHRGGIGENAEGYRRKRREVSAKTSGGIGENAKGTNQSINQVNNQEREEAHPPPPEYEKDNLFIQKGKKPHPHFDWVWLTDQERDDLKELYRNAGMGSEQFKRACQILRPKAEPHNRAKHYDWLNTWIYRDVLREFESEERRGAKRKLEESSKPARPAFKSVKEIFEEAGVGQ